MKLEMTQELAGQFVRIDTKAGTVTRTQENPDEFIMFAGPWPNPNIGTMQARCSGCRAFVGMSAAGMALHRHKPACRPIFCRECREILLAIDEDLDGELTVPETLKLLADRLGQKKEERHV